MFLFSLVFMKSFLITQYIVILNCLTLRNDCLYIKRRRGGKNDSPMIKQNGCLENLLVFQNSLSPDVVPIQIHGQSE